MKILHLNHHLSWSGGIETYLLNLVPQLEARGHTAIVGYSQGDQTLVSNSRLMPHLSRADRASGRAGYRQTTRLLEEERPDLVHVHNVYNMGALAACLDRTPTMLHGHDYRYLCPASNFYFRATETICQRTCGPACFAVTLGRRCLSLRPRYAWNYYRRVRYVAAHAHRLAGTIVPSEYVKQRFVQAGLRPERVAVIPYFCPLEPPEQPRPLPREATILFMGRLSPNKGYRFFVEALGKLSDSVRGLMVGNFTGEVVAEVRRFAELAGCDSRLEMRGWATRGEMQELYGRASVLVFPSTWAETFGIVGIEALAHGVPVVASDVGGVPEWLIDGHTGRLVAPKDTAALARAIGEILESPDQAQALGEQGRALVQSRFSADRHLNDLLNCYNAAACISVA